MRTFAILVAGSRGFTSYRYLCENLDDIVLEKQAEHGAVAIISGTARGTDQLGERYAKEMGLEVWRFPANWEKYGKAAGFKRNIEMVDIADMLVAFWDYLSKGTLHTIQEARRRSIPTVIVDVRITTLSKFMKGVHNG